MMLTGQSSRFAGETILVADDEKAIVDLTTMFLRDRGFAVLTAADGEQCLQMVEEHQPALVLLDYMMPVMDGLTALKKIRERHLDTHVIMFTGKGSEEVAVSLMKAGASDYLQKPFSNANLLERIDTVLQLRQIGMENRKLLQEQELLRHEIEGWNRELENRVREKTMALERAHEEILQVEKLAALGHISAGLAHEIRNPLNSINLFAQLLKTTMSSDPETLGYLESISQEVERIDGILVKMLAASRGSTKQRVPLRLADCVQRVLDLCAVQIRAQGVAVNLQCDGDLPLYSADPTEMEQIFSNLISNALFEMPAGGVLTISIDALEDHMKIVLSDTGKGIAQSDQSRVFDPFFTTKEKGTGFGLSVVLRIVKGYGGRIRVESESGAGATFIVDLPITESRSSA